MHISKIVDYVKNEISFSEEFCEDNVFVTLRIEPILKIIENLEQSHKDILEYAKEIEKKDKIIDRMSITIIQRDIGKNYCEFNKSCEKCEDGSRDFKCKDCIKQYFKELVERKSEEWKKI